MIRRLSIGPRSALAFGVIGIVMVLLGSFALVQLNQLNREFDITSQYRLPAFEAASDIRTNFLRWRGHLVSLINARSDAGAAEYKSKIEDSKSGTEEALERLRGVITTKEGESSFNQIESLLKTFSSVTQQVITLSARGTVDEAIEFRRAEVDPLISEISSTINELTAYQKSLVDESSQKFEDISIFAFRITLAIVLGSLVMMVFLAWYLTRSITQPLQLAVRAADTIASGDLVARIEVFGNDEPAMLLRAMQKMQQNLRETVGRIMDSSTQLASASEELSSVTEDTNRGLHQQNDALDQAATAVTELTAAIEEVARNATDTSSASELADSRTRAGQQQVADTLAQIEKLASSIEASTRDIEELAEGITDINKVLDVINDIADKTNLLSLNAAIEAARAGERGRGFAVVADEVRALAQRTQNSTGEIETIIRRIHNKSEHAVVAMRSSNAITASTLNAAHGAGSALNEISTNVAAISERNLSIASAAEQQAQVARNVDENLLKIKDLSTQSAAGASQTSSSSEGLAALAADLNVLVTRFRL